jgi:predicted helicase
MAGMRLRAAQRRWLETLLQKAGDTAVAVALPWVQHWRAVGAEGLIAFLRRCSTEPVAVAIDSASRIATDDAFADCCHAYLLEELLAVAQAQNRRRRGVYFTPQEIVRYIVQAVDRELAQRFEMPEGLASSEAQILDPAAGSGVFLAEAIRVIHTRQSCAWQTQGNSAVSVSARWNDYVSQQLLPRLMGWEIMPEGVVAAHCLVSETLRQTGYSFHTSTCLQIQQRDALAPPKDRRCCNVILGNPPYASLSTAAHGWIESLIQSPDDGYMTVDGRPLGEKKHWLHDDYVKFLRLAQWHIQQRGNGIVGLITNHGYLENASFRGMRASLLQTFPRIEIVDLHGNAKMRERSPDGSRDENVFGIASGATIGIFARPPTLPVRTEVHRVDLWGSRAEKLQRLASATKMTRMAFTPVGPHYRFSPAAERFSSEYDSAWRLCDAMPLFTTAPVTARDSFVVAFSRAELLERMEAFCDLSIPDHIVRQRYLNGTRSSRYPPGDSRSWKLSAARRDLAADNAWQNCIRLCQYRPLDYRYVLWHDALIDWPRREVLRHLLEHDNVALIARRQSPTGLPANYFWATQTLALDGIVRSDNRGSESLFPLWRCDDDLAPRANFAPKFIAECERALGQEFVERYEALSGESQAVGFTPLALAGYLYGLFWSADYRARYQRELASDFPRIVLPGAAASFFALSRAGLELLQQQTHVPISEPCEDPPGDWVVRVGFPRWQDGQVWINPQAIIGEVSAAAWNCRIGAHQVAHKWLKDRRGRRLLPWEITAYRSLVAILGASASVSGSTLECVDP